MSKNKTVDAIYKILPLFENVKQTGSEMLLENYLAYLNRVSVYFLGENDEQIYRNIRGLEKLGCEAEIEQVRRVVFHMIGLVKKEGV